MAKKPSPTEVDCYIFIKERLKELGWDTRNPEQFPEGQVWTQNECLSNPEIKRYLIRDKPENIVKVSESVLWVIEGKSKQSLLEQAVEEAKSYAATLNYGVRFQVKFISGVAGNDAEGFLVQNLYFRQGKFVPITINGIEATALLSPEQTRAILDKDSPNLDNVSVDLKLFLSKANRINEILHLGAINPHQRAGVMAALLLTTIGESKIDLNSEPLVLIQDINARVEYILRSQGKGEFVHHIKIPAPTTTDNHVKMRRALVDTLQELYALNIRSAMQSGDDWLGAFYEVFLKYASWAQDLGIVLTPRHITKFVAEVLDIQPSSILYDPTCGTGGFLVAGFDYVKQNSNQDQLDRFKQYGIFGIEQDDSIAALAVVNMIFRGDGKNNIKDGNCFANNLEATTEDGILTAKYAPRDSKQQAPERPPVTEVMMNPPFSLKRSDEREFKFIEYALSQMVDGGIFFSVLPYSSMVRPGIYLTWRKEQLLKNHTLLAVVTFPPDLFYPVGVTTVGVFIKKGIPHPKEQNVLWIRALNDGLLKNKGKRLPYPRVPNDLEKVKDILKAFIRNPNFPVPKIPQFQQVSPIDFSDDHLELVPESYLEQDLPSPEEIQSGLEDSLRNTFAYLIKIDKAVVEPKLLAPPSLGLSEEPKTPYKWEKFLVKEIFELRRGHFHSLAALDKGEYPTISRVSTDNGFVGFYAKPEGAEILPSKTITVSTVSGDAFVQPVPFLATDNVVLCTPKKGHRHLSVASLYFIALMMNRVKWRFSYGRQCYMTKYTKTEIYLPIREDESLDVDYMESLVKRAKYWRIIEASIGRNEA